MCSDNLTGIKKAINTAFPNTVQQRCIVHMIRNSVKFVSYKHSKEFCNDLRTIYKAEVYQKEDRVYIELTGNGFLYNMVRIIAGTLLDVGMEKIEPEEVLNIIESKNRMNAGKTLPAKGLCLVEVTY